MGTRGANRDAMVALLGDDAWVDALISEAYSDTWAGRTSAHHTPQPANLSLEQVTLHAPKRSTVE